MTLVFAVLAVVSFLRHGARGIPLVVMFAIGASGALFLCISDGLCQLPKVGADDTKAATATVSAARKRPDGFGERLEKVTGVEYLSCSTRSLGLDSSVDLDVGRLPSKDRYACRFVTKDGRLAEEMADVVICLGMLQDMYGVTDERLESWIDRKTERQKGRNRA